MTTHNFSCLMGAGAVAAVLLLASPAFAQSSLSAGTSGSAGLSGIKGAPGTAGGSVATDLERNGSGVGVGARVGVGSGSQSITGGTSASGSTSSTIERTDPSTVSRNNAGVSRAGVDAAQQQSTDIQGNEPASGGVSGSVGGSAGSTGSSMGAGASGSAGGSR